MRSERMNELGAREHVALMIYAPFEGRCRNTILPERRSVTIGA
jgi:hypothetical protein